MKEPVGYLGARMSLEQQIDEVLQAILVTDRTGKARISEDSITREDIRPPCTGLATLARKHCSYWPICRNCRLNNHRRIRCGYFERSVLPGLNRKTAERYARALGVALEPAGHGKVRVVSDQLPDGHEETHAT